MPRVHRTIAQMWESYALAIWGADEVGPVQREETKLAFYAGCMGLFAALIEGFDEDDEVTESDLNYIDSIRTELDKFQAEVARKLT